MLKWVVSTFVQLGSPYAWLSLFAHWQVISTWICLCYLGLFFLCLPGITWVDNTLFTLVYMGSYTTCVPTIGHLGSVRYLCCLCSPSLFPVLPKLFLPDSGSTCLHLDCYTYLCPTRFTWVVTTYVCLPVFTQVVSTCIVRLSFSKINNT